MNLSDLKYYKLIVAVITLSFILILALFAYESSINSQLNDLIDLIYLWVSTVTTVGFGDIQPVTQVGKLLLTGSMLSGTIMYFAAFSEIVLWIKRRTDARLMGLQDYSGENHVVIVGYNMMAFGLIHLLDKILNPEVGIVLVTNQLDGNPVPSRIHFIKSVPATTELLDKANIKSAQVAFILGNDRESPIKMDLNTLLIAGMIEDLAPQVVTVAELTSPEQKKSQLADLNIDHNVTFEDLLSYIRSQESYIARNFIIDLIPENIRHKMIKPELQPQKSE